MPNKLANLLNKGKTDVESTQQKPQHKADSPPPEAEKPAKPRLAGLKLNTVQVPKTPSSPAGKDPAPTRKPESGDSDGHAGTVDSGGAGKGSQGGAALTLDDLDGMEDPGTSRLPVMAGLIDASAPLRALELLDELPDAERKSAESFVGLIDGVYQILDDAEMLGNVIRNIMIELKANPQYLNKDPKKSLVAPDDIRVWIQAMRETMGLARIKKETRRSGGSKAKAKSVDMDMLADLDNMDLGI